MKRLSILILAFAMAFLVFFIGPPFLGKPFGPYPLMKVADILDIFTPLVLLPLYWLLYRPNQTKPISTRGTLLFMALAALWVEGQGMHLSANSVGHLLKGMENSDIYRLSYFYDEVFSHYLWHSGIVGLSAVIIFRHWRNPMFEEGRLAWPVILAGVIHGFTFFMIVIEGGTAPLGVTFAALATLFGMTRGRRSLRQQPLLAFFFIAYALATLLFAGWGVYWHGLPQFSELGCI